MHDERDHTRTKIVGCKGKKVSLHVVRLNRHVDVELGGLRLMDSRSLRLRLWTWRSRASWGLGMRRLLRLVLLPRGGNTPLSGCAVLCVYILVVLSLVQLFGN